MSCGLRDVANLERAGRPTLLVHTEAFQPAALRQSQALGQPALRRIGVPHPVQDKRASEIRGLAHETVDPIVAALVR